MRRVVVAAGVLILMSALAAAPAPTRPPAARAPPSPRRPAEPTREELLTKRLRDLESKLRAGTEKGHGSQAPRTAWGQPLGGTIPPAVPGACEPRLDLNVSHPAKTRLTSSGPPRTPFLARSFPQNGLGASARADDPRKC